MRPVVDDALLLVGGAGKAPGLHADDVDGDPTLGGDSVGNVGRHGSFDADLESLGVRPADEHELGARRELPPAEDGGPAAQYDKLSAGQECVSYLGSACAPGRGSHIAEDFAIVEVLDVHTGEAVAPGQRGTMVVTSLGRDNPMIRYDLEDVVRVDDGPCPCGETPVTTRTVPVGMNSICAESQPPAA